MDFKERIENMQVLRPPNPADIKTDMVDVAEVFKLGVQKVARKVNRDTQGDCVIF